MKLLALTFLALFPTLAEAEFQVSAIRTDFAMSDSDPRYRDVYVTMGLNQGIKKGSVLDAYRNLATFDDLNHRVGKNISFKIAKLKIIHADDEVSVARVVSVEAPDVTPTGTYQNVMVGDKVELGRK
jgi:hypothetical protein